MHTHPHADISRNLTRAPRCVNLQQSACSIKTNVGRTRIETRIARFPFMGPAVFYGHGEVGERSVACLWRRHVSRVSLAISSISVRPAVCCAFPAPVIPSIHDSAANARSVDNLFERRASNVSHLRNRASASVSARAPVRRDILNFAPFSCLCSLSCARDGDLTFSGDTFAADRPAGHGAAY